MRIRKIAALLFIAIIGFAVFKVFIYQKPHNPKVFGPPEKTQWKPVGARAAGRHSYDIIPEPTKWNAIHEIGRAHV